MKKLCVLCVLCGGFVVGTVAQRAEPPAFELVQPDLFGISGGQPNAWADVDTDGDLDLFVGFKDGVANRLYRNDKGRFTDVAADVGLADLSDTRAAAWGDFDADGHLDLYVGFTRRSDVANKLYRNDGGGKHFTDVAQAKGVSAKGETRQPAWIDFDRDGDLDLFVAMRDAPNLLYRNDGDRLTSVGEALGVADPRRTVGAVWFDADQDGDLDLFVANQNGDPNAFYRNDGARFVDVAPALKMDAAGRAATSGSNGPSVADYDHDGDLDLFVAGYGPNFFYRNDGGLTFTDVAGALGVAGGERATPSRWGDFDNDGRPDLYISSYIDKAVNERDYFFRNTGAAFEDVIPPTMRKHGATHGVQWADFDGDGDLDLALANNNPEGRNSLYRNLLPADRAHRSVQVLVLDAGGRHTQAGAEVRVFASGTRKLLGMGIVDTGGGYCSQIVAPVHIGLPSYDRVDVEVTALTSKGRTVARATGVAPDKSRGRVVTVRTDAKASAHD